MPLQSKKTTILRKGDLIIYLLVLGAALLLFLLRILPVGRPGTAVSVTTDDGYTVYDLDRDAEFTVTSCGVTLTVVIRDGSVSVSDADCPDRLCVKSGTVRYPGQSIVCLPAHTVIRIEAGKEASSDADIILG